MVLGDEIKALLGPYANKFNYHSYELAQVREHIIINDDLSFKAFDKDKLSDYATATRGGLHYSAGRSSSKDANPLFDPVVARGLSYNHGKFWQWWLADTDLQSAVQNVVMALQDADWRLEYGNLPDWLKGEARRRLSFIKGVFPLDSPAFHQIIREAFMQAVFGFSLHEIVWRLDGGADLEYVFPWQVQAWVTDASERKLLGVRCVDSQVILPASKAILWSYNRLGNDFEGVGILRQVGLLIELKQQLLSNYGISHYAFGVPWIFLEREQGSNAAQTEVGVETKVMQLLSTASSQERPVFKLASGYKAVILSASGSIPDPLPMLAYLDSKIATMLKNEGSLVGQQAVGAFNLAEQKDFEGLRNVRRWGRIIGMGLAPLLKEIELRRFGRLIAPGASVRLRVDVDGAEEVEE